MPSELDAMLANERLKGGAMEMKTAYLRGAWSLMGRMRALSDTSQKPFRVNRSRNSPKPLVARALGVNAREDAEKADAEAD